jgi:ABC-type Mn2+/Zn2+ transport system permease subunit
VVVGSDPGGVTAFPVKPSSRRTTHESLIGIGHAVASALAVSFVAKNAQGEAHLLDVLSGHILTVTRCQVWWMAGTGVAAVTLHALFHKQRLFSAFDPDTARVRDKGFLGHLFFFLILRVVISLAIRLAGTPLVFAFLVAPAVIALSLSQRMGKVYALAMGATAIATIGGLYASARFELPSAPAIVGVLFGLLCVALLVSRARAT